MCILAVHLVLLGGDDFGLAGGAHAANIEAAADDEAVVHVSELRRVNAHAAKVQLCMPPGSIRSCLLVDRLNLPVPLAVTTLCPEAACRARCTIVNIYHPLE
jgi:hypothetical protein